MAQKSPEKMSPLELSAWFTARLQELQVRLLVIGDFGEDLDDEVTTVLYDGIRRKRDVEFLRTGGPREHSTFELNAVIANLAPALPRAQLAKGTLRELGQPDVPVGVGTDCGNSVGQKHLKLTGISYMAAESEIEQGAELILRTLRDADDNSIILVLISGLTDIASIVKDHSDLIKQKVRSISIMGGVKSVPQTKAVFINAEGFMEPDDAANNKFDMESAKYVYRRFQELKIPLVILTRFAAGACQVPRSFYDDLAATGHPVGVKLRKSQQTSIEALWQRANLPPDDEGREKLPNRCNKEWFCNTFCGGKGKDRTGSDSIWDCIVSFNLYDPMTLVAAVPELRNRFFDPTVVTIEVDKVKVEHLIIGVCPEVHGVKDAKGLAEYMVTHCIDSLKLSLAEKKVVATSEAVVSKDAEVPTPPPKSAVAAVRGTGEQEFPDRCGGTYHAGPVVSSAPAQTTAVPVVVDSAKPGPGGPLGSGC